MKERDYINYRLQAAENAGKRRLLGPAVQREPWYSMNRPRNIIMVSAFFASLMFFKPISDVCYSFKNAIRLYREHVKFSQELDAEEASFDSK